MRLRGLIALAALVNWMPATHAADCAGPGVLGTSRVLEVDPKVTPQIGLKSFPQTLPLADKEVILTFDDGPFPATTSRILVALANECVHATFFLIGKSAEANPDLVKKIAAAGHTIGHHTWSHPNLGKIGNAAAIEEITRGIDADRRALGENSASSSSFMFFRFPGFVSTTDLLQFLKSKGIAVFGADLWASDWNVMRPQLELRLLTARLESAGKGIILLHDTKAQTAAMLPEFLRTLRRNCYKVVHVVPANPGQATSHEK